MIKLIEDNYYETTIESCQYNKYAITSKHKEIVTITQKNENTSHTHMKLIIISQNSPQRIGTDGAQQLCDK